MTAFTLTQSAVADADSYMEAIHQPVHIPPPPRTHFCIEIVEVSAPDDDFDITSLELPVLEPRKEYRVIVWTETSGGSGQKGVPIESDFDLMLALYRDKKIVYDVTIPNAHVQVLADEASHFRHDFRLIISEELPRGEVDLLLWYRPTQSGQRHRIVSRQGVRLAGTFNPPDEALLDKCKVALDAERPAHTAILYVEDALDDKIRLLGWGHYGHRPFKTPPLEPPAVRLADFIDAQTEPSEVISLMENFSRRSPIEFTRWIKKLHQKYDSDLRLLITDNANSEIPWEMFSLPSGTFLGELWSIARWFYIKDAATYEELWLQPKTQQLGGGVIAYCDPDGPQAAREKHLLDELSPTFHNTAQHLHQRLKHPLHDMGLVYLGTHGIFTYSNNKHQIAVGNWHNPAEHILALALERLPPCKARRPVFFVNACHSGRLIRDSLGLFGLPEILLSHVASGYIGTLGPVNVEYAVEVAEYILKKVRQEMGHVNPAEALRRIRALAAQQEREANVSDKDKYQKLLIYTFMYIYYGNPLAELHLTVVGEPENDDG